MTNSILETTKKLLGLSKVDTSFDIDIITHINTVFSILTQMGVGPEEGFSIEGYDELWESFITSDIAKTQLIKTYMHLKVKTFFDPSSNTNIAQATQNVIRELEYRLYVEEENHRQSILPIEEEVDPDE
jgi:hypothetical protein